jgi:hypothetical protein
MYTAYENTVPKTARTEHGKRRIPQIRILPSELQTTLRSPTPCLHRNFMARNIRVRQEHL